MTEAIFTNISERIAQELSKATQSIHIAVAWFTNATLFNILIHKAKSGISIYLALSNDNINRFTFFNHDELQMMGGYVYWVGDGNKELMHHKFCVIDGCTVITGSYNWSKKADISNYENITITQDNLLAQAFIEQFIKITGQIPKSDDVLPINKIIKRLEILKNYIILEDLDDIHRENQKLKAYEKEKIIGDIINCINKFQLRQAIYLIDEFIKKTHTIAIYQDVDLTALKLEIRLLEHEINLYDSERVELEKLLSDFNYRHSMELGDIISEILSLKKQLALLQNDNASYQEAKQDEKIFNENLNEEKQKIRHELSEIEQQEIKKLYRKASSLCHPDRVNDKQKEMASRIFNILRQAYKENDLNKVKEILNNLQNGIFKTQSETLSQLDKLKSIKQELRDRLSMILLAIDDIKNNANYQMIINLVDWDGYFIQKKTGLVAEKERLLSLLTQLQENTVDTNNKFF